MRRLAALASIAAALLAGAAWGQKAEASSGLTVFVVNESAAVTNEQLADVLPVMQAAVSHEFAQAWAVDASLYLTDTPPAGSWQIHLQDDSQLCDMYGCALGYHDLVNGSPLAYVYAQTTIDGGDKWDAVFSHELFEMLADPWLNRLALGPRLWLVEVADPVENDYYQRLSPSGVTVNVSDFVTPAWYRKSGKGPYDYLNLTKHRGELRPGGYVSYWTKDGWQQIFAAHARR